MLLIVEEMHRLHVNNWKNYPWNAYMYHGTELEEANDDYKEKLDKLFLKQWGFNGDIELEMGRKNSLIFL